MLDLPDKYLRAVRQILARHLPDAEVWAYGSRVAGGAREASDLDLVARNPVDLSSPLLRLSAARAAFGESDLPIRVDISDWARLPESFRREIEKTYLIVQKQGNHA